MSDFLKLSKCYTKEKFRIVISTFLFGLFVYALLITERLTNTYDGFWWGSVKFAGVWEISCGRFVWPLINRLRTYMSQDPYMSVISLMLISLALLIFDTTLKIEKVWQAFLVNAMFMANAVVCVFLSYRFMSPTFALSFLFSILAVRLLFAFNRYWNIIFAGFCLMISMGLYQANIGCTCVLILTSIILSVFQGEDNHKIARKILDSVLAAFIGGFLYIVLLKMVLKIEGISLSAYNGADSYSITGMIVNMPKSIKRSLQAFLQYFFQGQYYVTVRNRFISFKTFSIAAVVCVVLLLLYWFIRDKRKGIISLLLLSFMPIASNTVLFVATEVSNSIQMTAPMALVFPCIFVLFIFTAKQITSKTWKLIAVISTVGFGGLFAYLEILQVCWDQVIMLEGTNTTRWMFESTVDDLRDKNLLSDEHEYFYFGQPASNNMFKKSVMYGVSNAYARVGNFGKEAGEYSRSWNGIINNLVNINMTILNDTMYREKYKDDALMEEIQKMPVFPEEGYIRQIGDIIVVKVSDQPYFGEKE